MSDSLAKYSFIPFARTGLGNEIKEADALGGDNSSILERPEIAVSLKVKGSNDEDVGFSPTIAKPVKIQGPPDVLGINANQIIRVHPKEGVDNFETNNLAYAEFYEEDLPWRFTPAMPLLNKLRPWIALIVLKSDEFQRNTLGGTPTPYITIHANKLSGALSPETELHHFAHVHVLKTLSDGSLSASAAATALSNTLKQNPDLALSRVICPRKLDPLTSYHAFLVPSYETGRRAGLGLSFSGVKAQAPSWKRSEFTASASALQMPYYYTWNFETSEHGDFESLVMLIKPRTLSATTGREMDISDPGLGLTPTNVADKTVIVEGALKSAHHSTPAWPAIDQQLRDYLRDILNLNETLQEEFPDVPTGNFYSPALQLDPIVTPPIYGKWHALIDRLTSGNDWVHELNLHPTHRAAAGLGTRVVQEHQEEFMEMAWNQIGPINEANQKIIENEIVKRTSERLYRKTIKKMDEFTLMNTLGNAMEVLSSGTGQETTRKHLKNSRVPTAFKSGTFTKIAYNFTRTAHMTPDGTDGAPAVLNEALVIRADTAEEQTTQTGTNEYGQPIVKSAITPSPRRKRFEMEVNPLKADDAIQEVLDNPPPSFMITLCNAIAARGDNFQVNTVLNDLSGVFLEEQLERTDEILNAIYDKSLNNGVLTLVMKPSIFKRRISRDFNSGQYDITNPPVNGIHTVNFRMEVPQSETVIFKYSDVLEARASFRSAFSGSFLSQNRKPLAYIKPQRGALNSIPFKKRLVDGFNPLLNFQRKLEAYLKADAANKSKPLMAYPRFPIPVYDYLKDISPDYILPNVSNVPANTIALMEPNNKFVEAFLAGMNHEFSRELLWREFPTDMRGSYFRHFWEYDNDPSKEMLPGPGESESSFHQRVIDFQDAAADIHEMHYWNKALGANHLREFGLILLIKGDVFRKYPNTLVYAHRARFKDGVPGTLPRELDTDNGDDNIRWPMITGMIDPDIYFFGFIMDKDEALGDTNDKPGWFFVLRERPGQISFGLDDLDDTLSALTTWDDMTWEHLSPTTLTAPPFLNINGFNPDPNALSDHNFWNNTSAHTAYILYQNPVLFAKHATALL